MAKMTMVQALNLALRQEMEKDDSVIVLGEDVGRDGGVFGVTDGLIDQFGEERSLDTPLAESGIVGMSIGVFAALSLTSSIPVINPCPPRTSPMMSYFSASFRTRS